mmetsp:Transcript_17709/g.33339  ORF Transcript_17709/g.33339 Transcript_17709/m.33339 type:complete len:286 (-) Transcript_17709:261-1118(-)
MPWERYPPNLHSWWYCCSDAYCPAWGRLCSFRHPNRGSWEPPKPTMILRPHSARPLDWPMREIPSWPLRRDKWPDGPPPDGVRRDPLNCPRDFWPLGDYWRRGCGRKTRPNPVVAMQKEEEEEENTKGRPLGKPSKSSSVIPKLFPSVPSNPSLNLPCTFSCCNGPRPWRRRSHNTLDPTASRRTVPSFPASWHRVCWDPPCLDNYPNKKSPPKPPPRPCCRWPRWPWEPLRGPSGPRARALPPSTLYPNLLPHSFALRRAWACTFPALGRCGVVMYPIRIARSL